jgi:hypothetical protein
MKYFLSYICRGSGTCGSFTPRVLYALLFWLGKEAYLKHVEATSVQVMRHKIMVPCEHSSTNAFPFRAA